MKAVRIATVVLGLALAVYGTASLTGGWLGEPPWWTERGASTQDRTDDVIWTFLWEKPRSGREWISAGVAVAGLVLAVAAWPRRGGRPRAGQATTPPRPPS